MKFLLCYIGIGLLAFACQTSESERNPVGRQTSEKEKTHQDNEGLQFEPVTTAFQFPKIKAPIGFKYNFMEDSDSTVAYHMEARYLIPKDDFLLPQVNYFLKKSITKNLKLLFDQHQKSLHAEIDSSNQGPAINYYLNCRLVDYYIEAPWYSFTYVVDTYTEGGNHHNYDWLSINYNESMINNVPLTRLFDLEADNNKDNFIEILESYNSDNCFAWHTDHDFEHDVHFTLKKDSVVFMPKPEWSCGLPVTNVPIEALRAFSKSL